MADTDPLYSLRFNYRDNASNVNALCCILINIAASAIESFEAIASNSASMMSFPVSGTFRDFYDKIQAAKYKSEYAPSITQSLSEALKSSFASQSYREELIHYLDSSDNDKIQYLIKQVLVQSLGNSESNIQISFDKITRQDLDKTTMGDEIAGQTAQGDSPMPGIPPGSMIVNYKFVLSPVSGTKVTELREGMRIIVKITAGEANSNNAINLLNLKEDGGVIKNIPAAIVSIKHGMKSSEAIIKITDGIFGKYTEEEPAIKVKMAGLETLASVTSGKEPDKKNAPPAPVPSAKDENPFLIPILAILGILGVVGAIIVFVL